MYNRYIPQPDGTYRRRSTPDVSRAAPPPAPIPVQEAPPPPPPKQECPPPRRTPSGIFGFFKQVLPAGFDTGDLIVVLLLLLMAADSQEEQNTALLTLALYLFL